MVAGAAMAGWLLEFLTATGQPGGIDLGDVIAAISNWLPQALVVVAELIGNL